MGKPVIKALMFSSSIMTMIFGGIIGHVAYIKDIGLFGIIIGVCIFVAGCHSAWDLYQTFYTKKGK